MLGMNTLLTILALGFVLVVLAIVAYVLFEMSPFAHHLERFHDPGRRQQSPRLD